MSLSAVLVLLSIVGSGDPPTAAERIARGKEALQNLEYEAAAEELTIVAVQKEATTEERVEANLYAGIAHRVLGRDVDAKLNFVYVLTHAPQTELPAGTPPKIQNFYDLIRFELEQNRRVSPPPVASAADVTPVVPQKGLGAFPLTTLAIAASAGGVALLSGAVALGADAVMAAPDAAGEVKEAAVFIGVPSLAISALGAVVAVGVGAVGGYSLIAGSE